MPEGPEIRRSADALSASLAGRPALLVEFAYSHLKAAAKRLTGQHIDAIEPRGKAMLTHFSNGETIYSHNQLYGEWCVLGRGEAPQPKLQIRLAIHTESAVAVLYSASDIEVWQTAKIHLHPYIRKLGVELLAAPTRLADVLAQIEKPMWARKSLATALLDQGFLAGIGNYLRSEILFVARIHPSVRIAELSTEQRSSLAKAALELTRQSYRTAGITNDTATACRLKAAGLPFARYRHWVFDRAGESCHRCASTISRIEVSGRGLYWCSDCQQKLR
jgi:endonuclease VIII